MESRALALARRLASSSFTSITSLETHHKKISAFRSSSKIEGHARRWSASSVYLANKVLIKDVLEVAATKRDSKSYLQKFNLETDQKPDKAAKHFNGPSPTTNLGHLYSPSRISAIDNVGTSGLFEPHYNQALDQHQTLHTAIVNIRAPHLVNNEAISSIGRTISQLATLGMQSVVVVDPGARKPVRFPSSDNNVDHQLSRVIEALHIFEDHEVLEERRAQRIDQVLGIAVNRPGSGSDKARGLPNPLTIVNSSLICSSLRRGIVPVIGPIAIAFEPEVKAVYVNAHDLIIELVRDMHGLVIQQLHDSQHSGDRSSGKKSQLRVISIDRIIVLEPLGGIPSADRAHAPHVYINMEQEYSDIQAQLSNYPQGLLDDEAQEAHINNLNLLKDSLELLPDSSSGLIVTPKEVARSRKQPHDESGPRVQTRSKRNPLIHNLLTDKPAISSSLPYGRSSGLGYGGPTSTFVKRGMTLITIPDVFVEPWSPAISAKAAQLLAESQIDTTKLVRLIEASFGKQLDVERYMARIKDRFAGLVVAGDYEGCALFTWESSPAAPGLKIPYLDKFAVLPQSQGTGACVADILFTCMIMDCFPYGVCWRSRSNNPVNKWYFERAKGAWRIPGSCWTSFWTTDRPSREEFIAYESICRDIPSTWPS